MKIIMGLGMSILWTCAKIRIDSWTNVQATLNKSFSFGQTKQLLSSDPVNNCILFPSNTSISVKSHYQFILDGYHDNNEYNSYLTFIAGYRLFI
jgi:hypothetical protein